MEPEAATPSGGAEVSARADTAQPQAKPSTHERLKSFFTAEAEPREQAVPDRVEATPEPRAKAPAPEPVVEETESEAEPESESLSAAELRTLNDLAEASGLELDKLMDLDIPTKIDGKDGAARLRDLIKSYQLEGHLNTKLMTAAEEKKAFEAETQRVVGQVKARYEQLGHLQQLAERLLHGEFSSTNWDELRSQDPLTYNAKVVEFQQRQHQVNQLAEALGQERTRTQQEAAQQQQAYFQEQGKLLETKIPEWSDKEKREAQTKEMVSLAADAYGVREEEVRGLTDHRQVLILKDAIAWQKLQKSRPAIMNKVKAAPKLLRPGTQQSREAQSNLQMKADKDRLRKTGSIADAKRLLKRQLFN